MSGAGLYRAELVVTVESPVLCRGLGTIAFGVDATHIRDAYGRPIIPMTEIKGCVRHAASVVHSKKWACQRFGNTSDQQAESGDADLRGKDRLYFSDLALDADEINGPLGDTSKTTRIKIDAKTGAVADGMLLQSELIRPYGDMVDFRGNVHFVAESLDEAETIAGDIQAVLRAIRAIGAYKTVGYGRVDGALLDPPVLVQDFNFAPQPPAPSSHLEFELDRPLLVDVDQTAHNVAAGKSVIPGGVIKGALAHKLDLAGKLSAPVAAALGAMVISPAFPTMNGNRLDCVLAKSLFACNHRDNREFADAAEPGKWNTHFADHGGDGSISFVGDWKPEDFDSFANRYVKHDRTDRQSRTRVSICAATGAGKEGLLFTDIMVAQAKGGTQVTWKAAVHWPQGLDQTPEAAVINGALSDGLFNIGSTAAITQAPQTTQATTLQSLTAGRVRMVLDSPHLMLRVSDMTSQQTMFTAIATWFEHHSGGEISIDEDGIFAGHTLAGGWQIKAFATFGADIMEPFVLTEPGSVFVLNFTAKGATILLDWARLGLPAGGDWNDASLDWQSCPYLPENGFGAIRVDPNVFGAVT